MNNMRRLLTALGNETVKRIPYIIALLVVFALAGAIQSYRKTAEAVQIAKQNTTALKVLAEQNKQLSLDNKKLGEDNHALADQSKAYIKCIADIFAKFTQDRKPVIIEDLEKCVTSSLDTPQSSQSTTPSSQNSTSYTSSTQQTSAGSTGGGSQTPDPPKPPEENIVQKGIGAVMKAVNGIKNLL